MLTKPNGLAHHRDLRFAVRCDVEHSVIAVYDLEYWQPTYAVTVFLMAAERRRIELGVPNMEIIIRPGTQGAGFGPYKHWPREREKKGGRIDFRALRGGLGNIVLPMCHMLPSATKVTVLPDRDPWLDQWWAPGHTFQMGDFVGAYAEGIRPLRAPHQWQKSQMITITLRECGGLLWPARDSNFREWVRAGLELQRRGYSVTVVRDTTKSQEPIKGLAIAPDASDFLETRANLYASSALNLFVSNGPAWFCMALDAPMIMFRPACDKANANSSRAAMASFGVVEGQQMPGAPPHQRLHWNFTDKADIIINAVEEYFAHAQVESPV
jgi:hypothetical protein